MAARPTAPVTPFSTTSQGQAATSAIASGPARILGSGRGPAGPAAAAGAAPAEPGAARRRAPRWPPRRPRRRTPAPGWPAGPGWPPPAASPATRNRSGLRRMMSAAWVPIDPVEPSTTMSRRGVSRPAALRPSASSPRTSRPSASRVNASRRGSCVDSMSALSPTGLAADRPTASRVADSALLPRHFLHTVRSAGGPAGRSGAGGAGGSEWYRRTGVGGRQAGPAGGA